MATAKLCLARQYVDNWLEHLAGDVSQTPSAEDGWRGLGLDYADILHVLEVGHVTKANKEDAHESQFEITGRAIDSEHLCITIAIEPVGRGICILDVAIHSEQNNDYFNHNELSA